VKIYVEITIAGGVWHTWKTIQFPSKKLVTGIPGCGGSRGMPIARQGREVHATETAPRSGKLSNYRRLGPGRRERNFWMRRQPPKIATKMGERSQRQKSGK
jgi:hypothetical protein